MSPNWLARYRQRRQQHRHNFTKEVAHQLYKNREARGKTGDETTDWARAEKIVRRPWNRVLFRAGFLWRRRVEAFERSWFEAALEGLVNDLSNLAIIDLLGVLASLSLISGAVGYFLEADERRKQTHYQAWEVINSAAGREAESGRRAAIEDLWADEVHLDGLDIHNAVIQNLNLGYHCYFLKMRSPKFFCDISMFGSRRKQVRLNGANLGQVYLYDANLEQAFLGRVDLKKAQLERVDLAGAYLREANFGKAVLHEANLERAYLVGSNLEKAVVWESHLREIDLSRATLKESEFMEADLERASLREANLEETYLVATNLDGADLSETSLKGAYLIGGSLKGVDFSGANLERLLLFHTDLTDVKGLAENQLERALLCHVQLPAHTAFKPDRDCEKVEKQLKENFPWWSDEEIDRYISGEWVDE